MQAFVKCAMLMCNANSAIRSFSQQIQGFGRHSRKFLATRPTLYSIARPSQPGCTLELMNEGWRTMSRGKEKGGIQKMETMTKEVQRRI